MSVSSVPSLAAVLKADAASVLAMDALHLSPFVGDHFRVANLPLRAAFKQWSAAASNPPDKRASSPPSSPPRHHPEAAVPQPSSLADSESAEEAAARAAFWLARNKSLEVKAAEIAKGRRHREALPMALLDAMQASRTERHSPLLPPPRQQRLESSPSGTLCFEAIVADGADAAQPRAVERPRNAPSPDDATGEGGVGHADDTDVVGEEYAEADEFDDDGAEEDEASSMQTGHEAEARRALALGHLTGTLDLPPPQKALLSWGLSQSPEKLRSVRYGLEQDGVDEMDEMTNA